MSNTPKYLWVKFENSFTGSGFRTKAIPDAAFQKYVRWDGLYDMLLEQLDDPLVQQKIKELANRFANELFGEMKDTDSGYD